MYDSDSDSMRYSYRFYPAALSLRLAIFSLLLLLSGLITPARADELKPVHLRIGGREAALKIPPLSNGTETYVPLAALTLVGAEGRISEKGDTVLVRTAKRRKREELALARLKGEPMLALSDLARFLNAKIASPETTGPDGKPGNGMKADTVCLLAKVTDAHLEDGKLCVTTSFPVPYRVRTLSLVAPVRGYVDCLGATLAEEFHPAPLPDDGEKRVLRLRAGMNTVEIARIVVELADGVGLKAADSPANSSVYIVAGLDGLIRSARAGQPSRPVRIARNTDMQDAGSPEATDTKPKKSANTVKSNPVSTLTPQDQGERNPAERANVSGSDTNQTPDKSVSATPTKTAPKRGNVASRGGKRVRDALPIEVRGVKFVAVSDTLARLDIATTGKANPFVRYEQGAARLVVEIPNASLNLPDAAGAEQTISHPLVTGFHTEMTQDAPPVTRVTVEMERVTGFTPIVQNDRFSLELRLPRNATGALSDKLIVVDPGHGGSSTGATGHGGGVVYEKNVTLAIALKLRKALEDCGARVIMTRDRDVDVALYDRPAQANAAGADLFISIHNDSNRLPNSASGTSTYYHKGDASSRALAVCIQQAVSAVTGLPSRGALSDGLLYASGLAVLRASTMPAALCEVAYINNARDRARLVDPDFQQRVAQAICNGIRCYIEGHPTSERQPPPLENDMETEPAPMPDDKDKDNTE